MTHILPTDFSKLYELFMNFTSSYLGDLSQNYVPIYSSFLTVKIFVNQKCVLFLNVTTSAQELAYLICMIVFALRTSKLRTLIIILL